MAEDEELKISLELIRRYVRLLDIVIDAVMSVPARPGMVLEADRRRLRFAAAALGVETSEDVSETAGKIVGEALRRIEELRPAVELYLTHPNAYSRKREETEEKGTEIGEGGM